MPFKRLYELITHFAPPSLTAVSNAGRYISLRVRSSTTESIVMRRCSWEFAAKCFGQAYISSDWMPLTIAAASFPARNGSSEKYSKFLPHSGSRFILSPGPSTMPTPSLAASLPSSLPVSSTRASSQLFARAEAVGKQVAGTEPPSGVFAFVTTFLSPCGPSLIITAGMPSLSTAFVCQKSAPDMSEAFSSSVICSIRNSMLTDFHLRPFFC